LFIFSAACSISIRKEQAMASAVTNFDLAIRYETTRALAEATPAWKEYRETTAVLRQVFDRCRAESPVNPLHSLQPMEFAEAVLMQSSARQSAERKFMKWSQEPIHGVAVEAPLIEEAATAFEKKYLAAVSDETVRTAREAKDRFRRAIFYLFDRGQMLEQVLRDFSSSSERTLLKIQSWHRKYQSLHRLFECAKGSGY
jgi:hypothetical protein